MPLALRALLLILLALVPAGLVQIYMEREARAMRTVQLGEQAMRLARLVADQQVRMIEGARQVLATMTAHEAVRALEPSPECDSFLRSIVQAVPRYVTTTVLNRAGDLICSGRRQAFSSNSAEQPYFQQALADRGFSIGVYSVGRRSGQPSIHLSLPLLDEAGEVRGVVAVALSIEWLVRDLQALSLPAGASAVIADRNGVVLARSLNPERFVGRPLPPAIQELARRDGPGLVDTAGVDGIRRIAAFLPLTENPKGMFIALGLDPRASLAEAAWQERRSTILIVGSLLAAMTLALAGFSYLIERPVRRMLAVAARWGQQDWGARLGPIGGGSEFQRLGTAFDAMAGEVQRREAERAESENRLRALLDISPQVVFTANSRGTVTWMNRWWWNYTGTTPEAPIAEAWQHALHPDDAASRNIAWRDAQARLAHGEGGDYLTELRIRRASDGEFRWHACRAAALRDTDGEVTGWTGVALDVHDLRAAQHEAALAAERLRVTYETAPAGLCLYDRELRFLAINERLATINGKSAAAHLGRSLGEMAPHMAAVLTPVLRQVLETGQPREDIEVRAPDPALPAQERVWLANFHPVRDAEGNVAAVSGAVLDITARKHAEDAQHLLSREVDHRAKNVLAVVRSLVRLSAAEAPDDVNALVEVLEGRIAAMARVHTMLARERWVGADLGEIVEQELDAYAGSVSVEGPPVRLTATAAQPLTMVLHELATNAAKYGALSRPEGHLVITWQADAEGVALRWSERGGPTLDGPPARIGFGTRLIEANAGAQLAGGVEMHWEPEGLRCDLRIGTDALLRKAAAPLAGRRVLLLRTDLPAALALTAELALLGCEVVGPATTVESAATLLRAQGRVDAAVLEVAPHGRSLAPVTELLSRQAAAVVLLGEPGEQPADAPDATLLPRSADARALHGALEAALGRPRAVLAGG